MKSHTRLTNPSGMKRKNVTATLFINLIIFFSTKITPLRGLETISVYNTKNSVIPACSRRESSQQQFAVTS